MTNIVDDLLASVSERMVEFDPVDLRSVLIEVGNEMSVVASAAGVELVGALPLPTGRLSLVDVPEVPLRRSLFALIGNAIGHTERGGTVRVEAFPEGRWLVVRVIDQGHGITGIAPERVLDRFVGGTNVKDGHEVARESHGIGLSLVHDIATRYNGTVEVERTGPDGTVFRLKLPAPS